MSARTYSTTPSPEAAPSVESAGSSTSTSNSVSQEQLGQTAPVTLAMLRGLSNSERMERLSAASQAEKDALVVSAPGEIGPMDGVPVEMRYAANHLLVEDEVERLEAERERAVLRITEAAAAMSEAPFMPALDAESACAVLLEDLDAELARTVALADSQLLVFSPAGDGMIVEVFGDLEAAEHVAVVVPGIGTDGANYGSLVQDHALALFEEGGGVSEEEVATIAYLYDTPAGVEVGLDWGLEVLKLGAGQGDVEEVKDGLGNLWKLATQATTQRMADAAGEDLAGLMEGLGLDESTHTTAVGHSYGSLVVGQSMSEFGLDVDDAIFAGSPGVGVSSREELLRLDDDDPGNDLDTEIWSARAGLDYVSMGSALVPLYGAQPSSYADHDMQTGGMLGHGQYFQRGSESLANMGRVVTGQGDQVTEEHAPAWARDLRGGAVGLLNLVSTPFGGGWGDTAATAIGEAGEALSEGWDWITEAGGEALSDGWSWTKEKGGALLDTLSFWN